jgi:hypothetical protein
LNLRSPLLLQLILTDLEQVQGERFQGGRIWLILGGWLERPRIGPGGGGPRLLLPRHLQRNVLGGLLLLEVLVLGLQLIEVLLLRWPLPRSRFRSLVLERLSGLRRDLFLLSLSRGLVHFELLRIAWRFGPRSGVFGGLLLVLYFVQGARSAPLDFLKLGVLGHQ